MRKRTLLGSAAILLVASYGASAQTSSGQKDEGPPPSVQNTPAGSTKTVAPAAQKKTAAPAAQNSQTPATQATQPASAGGQNAGTTTPSTTGSQATAGSQGNPSAGTTTTPSSTGTGQNSGAKNAASPATSPNATAAQPTQAPAGTAQQSPQATPNAQQQAAQPNGGTAQNPQQQGTQPNAGTPQDQRQQAASPNNGQNAKQGSPNGVVSLNVQQRTQIGQALARHNVKPVTNVNFSIAVGTAVPRSVQLRAIPADLVTFIPQYRGYSYFVVEEQIVIVEPASYQIIAVVPYAGAGGNRAAVPAPTKSSAVKLTTQEREVVRKHTSSRRPGEGSARKTSKRYSVGDEVDTTVTVEEFPETVYREAPSVRRYRYFRQDNDVILVDPEEHRVIDVLE